MVYLTLHSLSARKRPVFVVRHKTSTTLTQEQPMLQLPKVTRFLPLTQEQPMLQLPKVARFLLTLLIEGAGAKTSYRIFG